MDNFELDDAIFLGLLLNEKVPSAEHPLKTPDCPATPEFEQLAANTTQWSLKWWLHKNNCPYCQLTLRLFREEMNIPPWWESLREKAKQAFNLLPGTAQGNAAWAAAAGLVEAAGEKEIVPAALLDADSEPKLVPVEVVAARFTSDQCGRLRIKLEEPLPGVKPDMAIELTLIAHPAGQLLGEFLLPTLNSCGEERLKVWLPPGEREAWRKLNEPADEAKRELPFRFILRPGSERPSSRLAVAGAGPCLHSLPRRRVSRNKMLPLQIEGVIYGVIPVVCRILALGRKASLLG